MIHLMRLQLVGAILVISALITAELAALALQADPASAFLWWMNIEVFRAINATYWMADTIYALNYPLTISALSALFALSLAAYWYKVRLALAVLSNLAFIYCGALAFVFFAPAGGAPVETASVMTVAVSFDTGGALVLYLLLSSLCGALASHLGYLVRFTRLCKTWQRSPRAGAPNSAALRTAAW